MQAIKIPNGPVILPCANEEEWHAARAEGVGGSEAPVIAGIDRFNSPYALWYKRKKNERMDPSDAMRAGNYFEPGNAAWFADDNPHLHVLTAQEYFSGLLVKRSPQGTGGRAHAISNAYQIIVRHWDYPWMQCTPDRILVEKSDDQIPETLRTIRPAVLQLKNVTEWLLEVWADQEKPPLYVQAQVQHEMFVCGMKKGAISAVIGGNKRKEGFVDIHPAFVDRLVPLAQKFMESLSRETPPEILDGSESTHNALKDRFPKETQGATAEVSVADVSAYVSMHLQRKNLDDQLEAFKARLKDQLGNAAIGTVDGVPMVSWKVVTKNFKPRAASQSHNREMRFLKGSKALGNDPLPVP